MKYEINETNGATLRVGSDCYPYTIIKYLTEKSVLAVQDEFKAGLNHDYYGNQVWEYFECDTAGYEVFTLRKNGKWIKKGQSLNDCPLYIGKRRAYQDPSF